MALMIISMWRLSARTNKYLIKMNADDLDYKYVNGENIFTVLKNIGRRSDLIT